RCPRPPISSLFPYTTLFRSPVLLSQILPAGILGLMMSAYFSAVLSTADSCLIAASGNLTTDLLGNFFKGKSLKLEMRISQLLTRSEEHTSELQSRENLVCRL